MTASRTEIMLKINIEDITCPISKKIFRHPTLVRDTAGNTHQCELLELFHLFDHANPYKIVYSPITGLPIVGYVFNERVAQIINEKFPDENTDDDIEAQYQRHDDYHKPSTIREVNAAILLQANKLSNNSNPSLARVGSSFLFWMGLAVFIPSSYHAICHDEPLIGDHMRDDIESSHTIPISLLLAMVDYQIRAQTYNQSSIPSLVLNGAANTAFKIFDVSRAACNKVSESVQQFCSLSPNRS